MSDICRLSAEEDVACQLAEIALQLHKRGWVVPYKHIIKARDVLLLGLDDRMAQSIVRKKAVKSAPAPAYAAQA